MKKFFKNHLFILITLVVFASLAGVYSGIVTASVNKFNGFKIVIDAGHGGRDGGSVGVNGTIEKDINLKYAKALKEKFVSMGYYVEMTRKTNDGLYSETAKNKKLSDLNERMKIT